MSDALPSAPAAARVKRILPFLVLALLAYGGFRLYRALQPYEWSGTVEVRTMNVGSRTGGRVKTVLVHEGDRLKAGQPLIELESSDWPAQLLAAQGQLLQAQANLEKLERGARPEEIEQAKARAQSAKAAWSESKTGARSEQIAAQRARVTAAEVALKKAELDAERMQTLFDKGASSRADEDNAQLQLESQRAQRNALKEQLDELVHGSRKEELDQAHARAMEASANQKMVESGSRSEDVKAARGMVDAAQGKVDSIKVMLDELTIKAPRACRVESLDLRPGDILQPSATAATLVEPDQLYVRIYVPETQLGYIKVSQEVPISVDSFPHKSFRGVVEAINTVGEFSPRNLQTADERADQVFACRIGLRDGADVLKAGMAAFIRVPK